MQHVMAQSHQHKEAKAWQLPEPVPVPRMQMRWAKFKLWKTSKGQTFQFQEQKMGNIQRRPIDLKKLKAYQVEKRKSKTHWMGACFKHQENYDWEEPRTISPGLSCDPNDSFKFTCPKLTYFLKFLTLTLIKYLDIGMFKTHIWFFHPEKE